MFRRAHNIVVAKKQRVNEDISGDTIRLVDESRGQLGIVSVSEAKEIAQTRELDLVEISPNAEPPVCRLMDYGKFLYLSLIHI